MVQFVSILVPVRNEERFLGETLRSLVSQRYDRQRFEVLVIDGGSTDDTVGVVRRLQSTADNLKLSFNPRQLSSAARNIGVRQSLGEILLIVDGHCEIRNEDYLTDLVNTFERWQVECVGRPQPLDVSGASALQQAIAVARSSPLGHNPGSFIYTDEGAYVEPHSVGIAYRRSVFEKVGLFDESFDACEDVEFNHRVHAAGFRCYLAPQLAVHYHPRGSLAGLAFQMQRYGRGRARLLLKHPQTFSIASLTPALFLCALAGMFVFGLVSPVFAALFCLTALFYSVVLGTGAFLLGFRRRAGRGAPLLPIVFLSIHVGAGWGVLAELCPRLIHRLFRRLRPLARALGPS